MNDVAKAWYEKLDEDGGFAFPSVSEELTAYGMRLRDYFAAKAMQSLIAEGAGFNHMPTQQGPMCEIAYDWADAMIKARAK